MKAIILSAGRGSRLSPLTDDIPKCLLKIGEHSILERQIFLLRDCGISEVCVVTGFQAPLVEDTLSRMNGKGMRIDTIFNPFYAVADNLVSCWMAAPRMEQDFILLNGDTLVDAKGIRRLMECDDAPVVIATNTKANYDPDDMKVQIEGAWITAIRKDLPLNAAGAESIGLLLFRDIGPRLFVSALDTVVRMNDGLKKWYLSAVSLMAASGLVKSCRLDDLWWMEIDTLADLQNACALLAPAENAAPMDVARRDDRSGHPEKSPVATASRSGSPTRVR